MIFLLDIKELVINHINDLFLCLLLVCGVGVRIIDNEGQIQITLDHHLFAFGVVLARRLWSLHVKQAIDHRAVDLQVHRTAKSTLNRFRALNDISEE